LSEISIDALLSEVTASADPVAPLKWKTYILDEIHGSVMLRSLCLKSLICVEGFWCRTAGLYDTQHNVMVTAWGGDFTRRAHHSTWQPSRYLTQHC